MAQSVFRNKPAIITMSYSRKIQRVIEKARSEGALRTGGVSMAEVAHDNWCAFLNGRGECNCDPTITIKEILPPKKEVN